jgi:hypothetical protein
MDILAVIIGLLGVSFILSYIAFSLKEEHWVLALVTMFVAIFLLLFVPKVIDDGSQNCQLMVNQSTVDVSGLITTYTYMESCASSHIQDTPAQFYWLLTVFVIISEIYLSVQFVRFVLDKFGGLVK